MIETLAASIIVWLLAFQMMDPASAQQMVESFLN